MYVFFDNRRLSQHVIWRQRWLFDYRRELTPASRQLQNTAPALASVSCFRPYPWITKGLPTSGPNGGSGHSRSVDSISNRNGVRCILQPRGVSCAGCTGSTKNRWIWPH